MTDEELAEIEEWFRLGTMYGFSRQGSVEAAGKAHSLIAEVRRLKAENERLRNEIHRLQPPMMDGGGYDLRNMQL